MKALAGVLLITLSVSAFSQTKHLTAIPDHSTVGFEVIINGGPTTVTGRFTDFDFKLKYVDSDWTKSSVQFTIQAESVHTGIPVQDDHLRSADFFQVEKYPDIKFISNAISRESNDRFTATGDFTMHGVSNEISIPFQVIHEDGQTIRVEINISLNRNTYGVGSDWQHSFDDSFLNEEIPISIYLSLHET